MAVKQPRAKLALQLVANCCQVVAQKRQWSAKIISKMFEGFAFSARIDE
jgi:hypothetical protein